MQGVVKLMSFLADVVKGTVLRVMHPSTLRTLVLSHGALCGVVTTLSTPSTASPLIHHGILMGLRTKSITLYGSVI